MPTYTTNKLTGNTSLDIPSGALSRFSSVNKFGRSTNVDSGVATDIWDRANPTHDQAIWLAPTAARIHAIASSDANDDGDPAGTGARTVQVFGLKTWDSEETSEVVTLNGITGVNTANSYVIIHRIKCLTWGSAGPNVGTITATAATDGTVTAQINPLEGQTQMAIYGIPSIRTAYLTQFYSSLLRSVAASGDMTLLFNPIPDVDPLHYLVKHTWSIHSTEGERKHPYDPYSAFTGPGILKIQAAGSANNCDVSAGFDLILQA